MANENTNHFIIDDQSRFGCAYCGKEDMALRTIATHFERCEKRLTKRFGSVEEARKLVRERTKKELERARIYRKLPQSKCYQKKYRLKIQFLLQEANEVGRRTVMADLN
jgi:hypothetical protein